MTLSYAYTQAMQADSDWQNRMDQERISRWDVKAAGELGTTLRELFERKLAADRELSAAFETSRKAVSP